jgi:glycosyltransferase involved in cell wall biosynthesis
MLAVVSPYTHLAGHYASYTAQLVTAYTKAKGKGVKVFTSWRFGDVGIDSSARATWTRLFASANSRNRQWGSVYDTALRNLEFIFCLKAALQDSSVKHIYCLDARHRAFFHYLHKSPKTFSHLCLGGPNSKQLGKDRTSYVRAFETNRLTFIVETEETLRQWQPIAGSHVRYIPVAVADPIGSSMAPDEARNHYGIPANRFVCLFFGTHREGKDYHTSIEAAKLASSKPFLVFAGPVISKNDPERIVKTLGFSDALVLNRNFRDGEEAGLFAACDIVVLPYAEGYTKGSAVLLQACKYGKRVIATNTGYFAEFIRTHHTGLLFTYGSKESLAECYNRSASEQTPSMFSDIRKTRRTFSWTNVIPQYVSVFSQEANN